MRWLRHRADLRCLPIDAGLWRATAHRYLHEGLDVIANHALQLDDLLARAHADGLAHLCLDGTLVPTDRVAGRTERGKDTWCSGKNRHFGGNVQVITDPTGFPLWVSDVHSESFHDLRCARELALPQLYPHTAPSRPNRIPVLADKEYIGAGAGVHVPIRRPRDGASCMRTTAPTISSWSPCVPPPSAPTRSSRTNGPCSTSPSTHDPSPRSHQRLSS